MADLSQKYSDNVRGAYYVDRNCIDCETCRITSPDNFKRNDNGGYSYVALQPRSPHEIKLCEEALANCPVEAIGNDG